MEEPLRKKQRQATVLWNPQLIPKEIYKKYVKIEEVEGVIKKCCKVPMKTSKKTEDGKDIYELCTHNYSEKTSSSTIKEHLATHEDDVIEIKRIGDYILGRNVTILQNSPKFTEKELNIWCSFISKASCGFDLANTQEFKDLLALYDRNPIPKSKLKEKSNKYYQEEDITNKN